MAKLKGLNPAWIDTSPAMPQSRTDHITRQFRELPYGEHALQKLDIYLPEQGEGPFPVIVNVHGGGLTHCDKHDFHLYPTMFALQQGFAVVAVNYRLSPEVHYPEHYYDLERALLWISQHGSEKSLDTRNIFLWGTSAGGNLVLQAGMKKGIPLPGELRAAKEVCINAVAAMCPGIDFMHYANTGTFFERLMIRILFFNLHKYVFGTKKVTEEAAMQSNPTTYIKDGMVPVYLQQGTRDPAVPFASVKEFHEKLSAILSPEDLVFHALEGAPHAGSDKSFFLPEVVDPILRFFGRHMRK